MNNIIKINKNNIDLELNSRLTKIKEAKTLSIMLVNDQKDLKHFLHALNINLEILKKLDLNYFSNLLDQGWIWYVDEDYKSIVLKKINFQTLIFLYKCYKNNNMNDDKINELIKNNNIRFISKKANDLNLLLDKVLEEEPIKKYYTNFKKELNNKNNKIDILDKDCNYIKKNLRMLNDKLPYDFDGYLKNNDVSIKKYNNLRKNYINYLRYKKKYRLNTIYSLKKILELIIKNNKVYNNFSCHIENYNLNNTKDNVKNNIKNVKNNIKNNVKNNEKNNVKNNNEIKNINANKVNNNSTDNKNKKNLDGGNLNKLIEQNNIDLNNSSNHKSNNNLVNNLIFQFTRHARSCNNDNKGKGLIGKDFEPGLTDKGIIQTIIYSMKNISRFNSSNIYVSCLLRTWCTAVLLYGYNKDTINLHVSPYLKEKHEKSWKTGFQTFLTGNHPEILGKTLPKFLKFLNYINILIKKTKNQMLEGYFNNMPNKIRLLVYSNYNSKRENFSPLIFELEKQESYYNLPKRLCDILPKEECLDPIMKKENIDGFQKNGNLFLFIKWFIENFQRFDNNNMKKVHVVAHSKIMKDYLLKLKSMNIEILSNDDDPLEIITETNCSMILTNIKLINTKIYAGYRTDSYTNNIDFEKVDKLCGNSGEAEILCTLNKTCSTNHVKSGKMRNINMAKML